MKSKLIKTQHCSSRPKGNPMGSSGWWPRSLTSLENQTVRQVDGCVKDDNTHQCRWWPSVAILSSINWLTRFLKIYTAIKSGKLTKVDAGHHLQAFLRHQAICNITSCIKKNNNNNIKIFKQETFLPIKFCLLPKHPRFQNSAVCVMNR